MVMLKGKLGNSRQAQFLNLEKLKCCVFLDNIIMSDDYVITTGDLKIEATESLGVTMFKHMKKHKDNVAQVRTYLKIFKIPTV
jgi:hypothetical protein